MKRTITPFSAVCVFVSVALAEGGKIEHTILHSQALEKNMLRDSPNRALAGYSMGGGCVYFGDEIT